MSGIHDKIYFRVLRELADVVIKPHSMIFEKSWQTAEVPVTGKKAASHPFLRRVERMIQGTTDLSALTLC